MRSDDEETAQTVSFMDELANAEANEAAVANATSEALDNAGLDENAPALAKAQAIYWWLKRNIRYVPTPGTSPLVDQTLIAPCTVLAMPEPIGDCPQFSMLAAAMFRVLCMNSMFVTIAAEPAFPDQWSHIYNTVEVLPGQYMPFDSSNGPAPGAEYAKPYKRRVWPRIAPGRCRTKEGPTQMMRNAIRPAGMRNSVTRRAVMGDVGDYSSDQSLSDQVDAINALSDSVYGGGSPIMTGPNPTSAQLNQPIYPTSSTNPLSTFLNDVTAITAPLVRSSTQQQPYFITSPSGQSVLYNPNTGTVGGGAAIASAINPTYLVIGVAAIAALAFLGKK